MTARGQIAWVALAALALSGCAGNSGAICAAAGGTYAAGTCSRSSSAQAAAAQACETRGGVYLAGQDSCAFGMGR